MKRRNYSRIYIILIVGLISYSMPSVAQLLKLNPRLSTITISGTTNVHDWKSNVGTIKGDLVVNSSKQIQSLQVDIPVTSIKSDEKLMDKKTYEAFDSDKNPTISFKLTEVNSLQIKDKDVNAIILGNLTMAGVSRKISIKTNGKNTKNGTYEFKGTVDLKMTDFKMKPPTALLGVMKVGDAVKLNFNVIFEGSQIE